MREQEREILTGLRLVGAEQQDVGVEREQRPGRQLREPGARIDEGAFLGMNAGVIGGACVGAWSTVGAGGSVVRDVPARSIAVGVPARVIRSLGG